MRIKGEKLRKLAKAKKVGVEDLAKAIERTGLKGDHAVSAVKNWMQDRDHPRCRASDMAKLAQALGEPVRKIAKFTSRVLHHRGSPRKAGLLVDLIRGKDVIQAENMLMMTPKRAALNVRKALKAAIADAQAAEVDEKLLFVSESRCDGASIMKRFQPKDRGRAHPIEKRFSHITVSVEERA